jgi:arylsulfatase A-like enzyme
VLALLALVGLFVAPNARRDAQAAAVQPNILFIITDDQPALGTLSVMPNTRQIFQDGGTDFTNFYDTTPLCCPSRGSFWIGQYAHNHGVKTNGGVGENTYAQSDAIQAYLKNAGYTTGIVGKYWNKWPLKTAPPNYDKYLTMTGTYNNSYWNVNGTVKQIPGYTNTVIGDYANQFLQGFESNDAKPWFLYVAPEAPHAPFTAESKYASASVPSWNGDPAVFETDKSDKPPAVKWRNATFTQGNARRTAQLRTLMSVDDLVKRIFDQLTSLGEADNTLAIFTTDNGYMWAEHGIMDKRFPYTQSVQLPFLMRWPGHVTAGATDNRITANIDVEPTLLEAAGITPQHVIDGTSLFSTSSRSRLLLEYFLSPDSKVPSWSGDLTPTYEYVEWYDTSGNITFREYYDLVNDPWELTNLLRDGVANNNPDVNALHATLTADRSCAGSECP